MLLLKNLISFQLLNKSFVRLYSYIYIVLITEQSGDCLTWKFKKSLSSLKTSP